jgi:predicted ATPase/signal transduction histidine kinase
MLAFPGFAATETLFESERRAVFRARRESDDRLVVVKALVGDYPTARDIALFRHEYTLTQRVGVEAVAPPLALHDGDDRLALVFGDVGGTALAGALTDSPLALTAFFPLAIGLTRSLGRIHDSGIIHKDLNPSNIIVTPGGDDVRIIDFSIASALSREEQRTAGPGVLEGALAYISPEQTGRMNRLIDWRTDFYSLGITLYRMLTGRLPFESADALEMMHFHIARLPTPPHIVAPGVPLALSRLVLRLLAKSAEERYHSAHGIVADLEACAERWAHGGADDEFTLAREDLRDRFQIPQRLYGREQDVDTLLGAFERVSAGGSELLLIRGLAGIGKSAVVSEIQKPVLRARGYFVAGKLDQLQRNVPFAAVIQAMQELVRQLLAESDEQLAAWRDRFTQALGANGQVIVDVIPEMELIAGPQRPVMALPPGLALNRFNIVFQRFIRVFASAEHPLVMFLDDLQWADLATLELVQVLIGDPESRWLLVIGAYRDNEVSAAHPLRAALDRLAESGRRSTTISLEPLSAEDVTQLVRDTLHAGVEADELATVALLKTSGNPFFVNEFLKTLHEERLVVFHHAARQWRWDIEGIRALAVPDRVVDLMAGKLRRLPAGSLDVVEQAACIGAEFELGILARTAGQSPRQTAAQLWEPMAAGLIFPIGADYRSILAAGGVERHVPDWERVRFRFMHDRVQQAAYALIDDAKRPAVHLRIGRLLEASAPDEASFEVVDHLNRAQTLIVDPPARLAVARLNNAAAERAMASTAFGPALQYAESGVELLGDGAWRNHREMAVRLHLRAAECAALVGAYEQMETHCAALLAHEASTLEWVAVQKIRVMARMAQNRLGEAVDEALAVLPQLGITLPRRPSQLRVLGILLNVMARIGRRTIADLGAAPEMTGAREFAAMQLLTRAAQPAYYARPNLLPVILLRMVALILRHGNSALAPYAWLAYGHVQNLVFGDIRAATRYGDFALDLMQRYDAPEDRAKLLFLHANFIQPWTQHWRNSAAPLQNAYLAGLDSGEFEYGATAIHLYCHLLLALGTDLEKADTEMTKYNAAIVALKQLRSVNNANLRHQVVLNLLGRAAEPWRITGERYDEPAGLASVEEVHDVTGIAQHHFYAAMLRYLFGRPDALEAMRHVERNRAGLAGLVMDALVDYYLALIHLDAAAGAHGLARLRHLAAAWRSRRRVARWHRFAPMNHAHRLHLIDAERARVTGREIDALGAYDRAIAAAHAGGFTNDEALALERAARFLSATGSARAARAYALEARSAYGRWNAHAKVAHLEETMGELLGGARTATAGDSARTAGTGDDRSVGTDALDLRTVLKAAQALAGEIVLPRLLERLMSIAVENAGAERGFLLLDHDNAWRIAADVSFDDSRTPRVRTHPLDSAAADPTMRLAASVVAYVARTRKPVVLRDAAAEGQYTRDAYVAAVRPRSVLCAPLVAQGKLSGIMYLENSLTADAFTPARLGVLQMLSGQAGIALENARLYDSLERRVEERTHELSERTAELAELVQALRVSEREARDAGERAQLSEVQAQEANRAKTVFLTSMSHELRTPINAIIGFSELLEEEATDAGETSPVADLRKIRGAAKHLLSLINDVLDLSKIEAGRMDMVPEPVDARALLDETIAIAEPLVARNANHLVLDCAADVGTLRTDGMRLRQVLLNLLSNASKFTDHGTITVTVRRVRTGDAELAEFRVSDTGIGMTPEQLGRLFLAFSQADATIARKYGGTGIGLVVVRRLSQLLGGDVTVESEAGRGTTFTVHISANLQ